MTDDKPTHLRLVTPNDPPADPMADEFEPLPYYSWLERPATLPLTQDEAATAIHLTHGELENAANLLKVPLHRLTRLIKASPRLVSILHEALEHVLIRGAKVPIDTLFDENAGDRRKEWASTAVLKSRLAMGHPLSPAPAANVQSNASLEVNQERRSITFRWRTAADNGPDDVA